ncbi:glycosyltransferase family protein [Nitrospina watsonii]|uniref:Glycosyltransferase 2-like domain-containing protein n=1 Tax=Nitrospina watsonii TaxID=1323948 RepID=A0ABN8VUX5_9BACT|nr:glycosyltransferase [Nitrospina watsonii]CAI2716985.1 protein of unknown function [Nitrospina watsonii]
MKKKKTLKQLYSTHEGKVSDKWSSYLAEYERIFLEYRDKPIRLLEIGVQNGGSLEIWSGYFSQARKFVGCDIDSVCAHLNYDDSRIAVVIGDINSNKTEAEIRKHAQNFDIIIDDGSHQSSDIVKSFVRYFPCLADGGVFVAEDLHCSYWQEFEGGLYSPYSAITFFKRLADITNYEHWGIDKARTAVLSGFISKYGLHLSEETLQNVHSVQFINSLCVIRKDKPVRNRLSRRVIAGSVATVKPEALGWHSRPVPLKDQSGNDWAARSMPPEEELVFRIKEIDEVRREQEKAVEKHQARIDDLEKRLKARDVEIKEKETANSHLKAELRADRTVIEEFTARLREQAGRIGEFEETAASLKSQLEIRRTEAGKLAETLRERESKIQQYEETVSGLNDQLEARRTGMEELSATLRDRDEAVQEQCDRVADLENRLQARKTEAEELKVALESRDATLGEYEATTSRLNDELQARRAEMEKLTETLRERDDAVQEQRARAEDLESRLNARETEAEELKSALENQAAKLQEYKEAIAELSAHLEWRLADAEKLAETLRERKAVIESQSGRVAELENRLQASEAESEKLAEALRKRDFKVQQYEETVSGLNDQLEARRTEAQKISAQLRDEQNKSKQILAGAARRIREISEYFFHFENWLSETLKSKRWKAGNLMGNAFSRYTPDALKPAVLGTAKFVYKWVGPALDAGPEDWEKELSQIRSRVLAAAEMTFLDRDLPEVVLTRHRSERIPARAAVRSLSSAPSAHPLVSIIVLTRDGKPLLDAMFRSFLATNSYPAIEFVVVDHASTDGTDKLLDRWARVLPIRALPYETNNSFSFSNNRAAEVAEGSLLLLLNNDVIFSDDVIGRMVAALENENVGAVGLKQYLGSPASLLSQEPYHIGVRFKWDSNGRFLRPYNVKRDEADDLLSVAPASFPAVTGSALLCRRAEFLRLGGLSEEYSYGFEDIDFCCKIRFVLQKEIVSLNDVFIYHNESTTRAMDSRQVKLVRASNNVEKLKVRFGSILSREYREKAVFDDGSVTGRRFTVGIAVTTTDTAHGAGDLFTALGLGRALQKKHNWTVHYLAKDQWYDVRDIDLYIAMRDDIDIRKLVNVSPHLIKIAWLRNWFDRWVERPWLQAFDMHLSSSQKGADFIKERVGLDCEIFPIGVALDLFNLGPSLFDYENDYVFTGNYWNAPVPREIEAFDPQMLSHKFAVYGKNWDEHKVFAPYHRGFVNYVDLSKVYNSTKITVDDTVTHVTKRWGSLNSRVFEALAAGSLVLTNNAIGSAELFEGRLPVWNDVTELTQLIDFYLRNPEKRDALMRSLREQVLAEHSYERRANKLIDLIAHETRRTRIAIKCPVPHEKEAAFWGDYHLAKSLAKALRKFGHRVRIDLLPEWTATQSLADDVTIVFRGRSAYAPSSHQVNICWLISHPDEVLDEELEQYDHVFVASLSYAKKLATRIGTPVTPLLQCSDPDVFHPPAAPQPDIPDLLFVGNSRRQRRKVVYDALAENLPIAVYGRDWEELIDSSVVRGQHINNEELHTYYGSARIVLNDHWPDMAENGFISNRIFDVALSGGFVISDEFTGSELFGDAIVTYDKASQLRKLCEEWLTDDQRRVAIAARLREIVLAEHTVDHRAVVFNDAIEHLAASRRMTPVDEPLTGKIPVNTTHD